MPDHKRRVVLPPPIAKGDILLLDEAGENRWVLTRLERPKRKPRLPKGKTVAEALAASAGADVEIAEEKKEPVRKVVL
jgi:hypothetical protein